MKKTNTKFLVEQLSLIEFNELSKENELKINLIDTIESIFYDKDLNIQNTKELDKVLLNKNLSIHKHYSELNENLQKALLLSLNKNNDQVKKYSDLADTQISEFKKNLNKQKKEYNNFIIQQQDQNLKENIDNLKIFEENNILINKEINENNVSTNQTNEKLENEKNQKLVLLKVNLENEVKLIKDKITVLNDDCNNEIDVLRDEIKNELTIKDNNYLTIKKTHSQSNIKLNSFINSQKDVTKIELEKQNDKHNELVTSLELSISKESEKHNIIKDEIQERFLEKTKALNIVFDVQKDVFNSQTAEIIAKHNADTTVINKITRENSLVIEQKITNLEREKWKKQAKAQNSDEKSNINKEYNKLINSQKLLLLNLNKKNQLELKQQEEKFQKELLNHDYEHIKQINEWRFSKNLFDLEKKEELNKELYRYKHEMYILDKRKIKNDKILKLKLDIERIILDKDMLPIESQVYFASSLQNREISLLNLEFESNKLNNQFKQKLVYNTYKKEELALRLEINKLQLEYDYQVKVISIRYQLQIEKEILKRNINNDILKSNLTLQSSLLEKNNNISNQELKFVIDQASANINKLNSEFKYNSIKAKKVSNLEQTKRSSIIQEIKIKNQLLVAKNKNQRSILLSKNFTETKELINRNYFEIVLNLYYKEENLYKILLDFINTNVNTDTISRIIEISINAIDIINDLISSILDEYYILDSNESKNQLIELSDYKYRIKHEEIIDKYNENISLLNNRKIELTNKDTLLKEEYTNLENKFKQNILLHKLYNKNKTIHNSNINYKDEVKNLKNENIQLKKSLLSIEKQRQRIIKDLMPLNDSIKRYNDIKINSEETLKLEISQEQSKYNKLLEKHEQVYYKAKDFILDHKSNLKKIYTLVANEIMIQDKKLSNLNNKYSLYYTSFFSNLLQIHQSLLSFWLNNHLIQKNEQQDISNQFESSSTLAIEQIKNTYKNYISFEEKDSLMIDKKYLLDTKELDNAIATIKQDHENTIKTITNNYNTTYSLTMDKVNEYKNNIKNSNNNINANLNDVLEALDSSNQRDIILIDKEHIKELNALTKQLNSIQNDINTNISRTNSRTNLIISNYETERNNYLKLMNTKRNKFNNNITKLENNIKNINDEYNIDISNNAKLMKKSLKDLTSDKNHQVNKFKNDKNKLTKKERKTLKKSYIFKSKQM